MGKRGPKPRSPMQWSSDLAYAIGLIATDGCLYNDGRHINFTSKDIQLIHTFKKCLGLTNRIGRKSSGFAPDRTYYNLQFGNVTFYQFLIAIGLTPAKSRTLGSLKVPDNLFADFLRGIFDGDGSFYSYIDKRWRSSFLFYIIFNSASMDHVTWLRNTLNRLYGVRGHGLDKPHSGAYQLKYAKREGRILIEKMYYKDDLPHLERKREKVYNALEVDK